jgi:hypothetical protein
MLVLAATDAAESGASSSSGAASEWCGRRSQCSGCCHRRRRRLCLRAFVAAGTRTTHAVFGRSYLRELIGDVVVAPAIWWLAIGAVSRAGRAARRRPRPPRAAARGGGAAAAGGRRRPPPPPTPAYYRSLIDSLIEVMLYAGARELLGRPNRSEP